MQTDHHEETTAYKLIARKLITNRQFLLSTECNQM